MSDLISREAVLEVQIKYAEHMGATKYWQMRDDIRALPSVTPQPEKRTEERTESHACDCISRQAVIDRINKLIEVEKKQGTDDWGYGRERVNAYEAMLHFVKSEYLYPSVEPEMCGDCINREAALEILDDYAEGIESGNWGIAYSKARTSMCELPSVEPERKTGKWIYTENHCWICSECGKHPLKGTGFTPTLDGMRIQWKFCNRCGAKMEVHDEQV